MDEKLIDKFIDTKLKNIAEEPLPEGFTEDLHLKLVEASKEKKTISIKPFINIAAAAAVIAIIIGINSYKAPENIETDNNANIQIANLDAADSIKIKSAIVYGEYEVTINSDDIINKLNNIAEIKDNIIICDENQFEEIFSILLDNNIELKMTNKRENNILIKIK